jgi:Cell division protein CrgA
MTTPASGNDDRRATSAPATAENEQLVPATRSGRHPSPPWYGGTLIGTLFLMAAIVLSYTLLDWDWQQRLGWWNYVITLALIPVVSVLMKFWQADETI